MNIPQRRRKRLKGNTSTDLHLKQKEALRKAQEAASSGDPKAMATALVESRILDGLTRNLEKKWYVRLSSEDIEDTIAAAVETLYVHVNQGRRTTSIAGFLWKTACHKASDAYYSRRKLRSLDDESLEDEQLVYEDPMLEESVGDAKSGSRLSQEEMLRRSIAIAREIIRELGSGNVKAVMEITIDFVEKGYEDLTSREVGDILGLKPATVRKCWERGFQRLETRSRDRGITLESSDFITFEGDEDENSEESNVEE